LLGGPGHRDVAVDRSFDPVAEGIRGDEDDEVELQSLRQFRGQGADAGCRPERGIADDTGDSLGMLGEPGVEDRPEVRNGSVQDGETAAADGRRHVGVRQRGQDDRLGLGHDLLRRPVVDGQ
jgi:hypothetical protein